MSCWPARHREQYDGVPCCRCYGCRLCFSPQNTDQCWTETNHGSVIVLRSRPDWNVLKVGFQDGHVYYQPAESLPSDTYYYKVNLPVELIGTLDESTLNNSIYVQGNEVFFYRKIGFTTLVKLLPTRLEELQQKYGNRLKTSSDIEYHRTRAEFIVQVGSVRPLDAEALRELVYSLEQLPDSTVEGLVRESPNCQGQFGKFYRLRGQGVDLFIKLQDVSEEYHRIIYTREREMTQYVSRWKELREAELCPELIYYDDAKGMLIMKWIPNIGNVRSVMESDISDDDKLMLFRDCFQLLSLIHQRMMHLDAHIENILIRPLNDHETGWSSLFRSTVGRPVLIDYSFSHVFDGTPRSNLNDVFTDREELDDDLPGFDFNYLAGGVILTLLVELKISAAARQLYELLIKLTEENWKRVLPDYTINDLMKLYEEIHQRPDDPELIDDVIKVSNYFPDPFERCIIQEQIPDLNNPGQHITIADVVSLIDEII